MYLMIENPTEAPIEAFLVSGLSTARGQSDKIGQFGTGNKHAILVLLRHCLETIIYSGTDKYSFGIRRGYMNGTAYDKVVYQIGNKKEQDTNWALEHGAMDWTEIYMALREFVSNAIDVEGHEYVNIELTNNPRAKSGCTRVFVELNDDVKEFYDKLDHYFLHFINKHKNGVLEKSEVGPAKIYRKGVYVRTIRVKNSLFDYNFGDELKIDECRNMEDYSAASYVGQIIHKYPQAVARVLRSFNESEQYWEQGLGTWSLTEGYGKEKKLEAIKANWDNVFGDAVPVLNQLEKDVVERKGRSAIIVPQNWLDALGKCGVQTSVNVVSDVEKGNKILAPTVETVNTLNKVWGFLEDLNLTNGKDKPPVQTIDSIMNGGSQKLGYYHNGVVYINRMNESDPQTMLEELAHHITGSGDNCRDFQDFAFRVAANSYKLIAT